jgi:diguanylate cyclase (GGDEF)-like protein
MTPAKNLRLSSVLTLNAGDFPSIEELRTAVEISPYPVLLVGPASDLPELVSIVREGDDICLDSDPGILVDFRQQRLVWSPTKSNDVDPLTQVRSRQSFLEVLCEMSETASQEQPVSLIVCDIDHFKETNDEHGHAAGDRVLCNVAATFEKTVGDAGSVGRMGGDEFAVVCRCNNEDAKQLAEKLRVAAGQHRGKSKIAATLSLGIATIDATHPGSDILEKASKGLYAAKSSGRNTWCCVSDLEEQSRESGNDIEVTGLENMAKVLAERVANMITMRSRKLLTHVREEADVDALTGCFNRRYLDRTLEIQFNDRDDCPLSVAFLDLDHFGLVNKEHGWSTGDKLLVEVCSLVRNSIRSSDWIGRYGGEEFCIVMPGTTAEECQFVLNRIREKVEQTEFKSMQETKVPMTVSVGATCATDSDENFSQMLERASQMALLAKRSGRNRVCLQCA